MSEKNIARAILLSLIKKSEVEQEKLLTEVESILNFVADIQSIKNTGGYSINSGTNVFREDVISVQDKEFKEKMLTQAPVKFKDFIVSKKVLE